MSFLTEPVTVSRWVLLVLVVVAVASVVLHLLPFIRAALKSKAVKKGNGRAREQEPEKLQSEPVPETQEQIPVVETEPYWDLYKEDSFHSLRWKWTYTDQKEPQEIDVYCPRCDTLLRRTADQYWVDFACDSCGNDLKRIRGNMKTICAGVKKDVERKISTGAWKLVKRRKT